MVKVASENSKELQTILDNLPSDLARRKRIVDYDANIRDQVRRYYLLKGPCQLRNHKFPQKLCGGTKRRFVVSWFDDYSEWLEYSIELNAAFCLHCYLFKQHHGDQGGDDVFTSTCFSNWKSKKTFEDHIGGVGSVHNQAQQSGNALKNQNQHLETFIDHQTEESKNRYYRVEVFCSVIDRQLSALNDRFDEINNEILICVASLSPKNSFDAFDKHEILQLAKLYPRNFSERDVLSLEDKLDIYINEMRSNGEFAQLKGLGDLARKLVETRKHLTHASVYKLLTLALVLPVATTSVEKVFLALNIVKNPLRNRMVDQWTNDCLIVYVEKDIFNSINNDVIIERFQNMKSRRGQLPSRR